MSEQVIVGEAAKPNIEEVIGKYIDLRDTVERKTAALKDELAPVNAAMKTIESYLMSVAIETGQTKFGTARGTAFITTKTACNVADWDQVLAYIKTHDAFHILNKAVNKTAVGEIVDATGAPVPGVNWVTMKEIQVRRA
jgi:hypothetical protein